MDYHETLKAVRATNSRNDKVAILKQSDTLTHLILRYAYDPFKHYYINRLPAVKHVSTDRSFNDTTWTTVLRGLKARSLSGENGKLTVLNLLSNMSEEDADLFRMVLKKDLRCGISAATINLAIPGLIPVFGMMLAKKWAASRYESNLIMSIKLDGLRARLVNRTLYTRNGHEILGVDHITKRCDPGMSLDGELMVPGEHFQKSSGLLRSDNPTPTAVLHAFDAPDVPMGFLDRYEILKNRVEDIDSEFIRLVKHVKVRDIEHINTTFDKALDAGHEGLVIKTAQHPYQTKRSWDWMKLKAQRSEDLKIQGFFEGAGKFKGTLGGIIVERANNVRVRVGSGFGDEERDAIWNDKKSFLKKMCQVDYHEETPDGSLRHPVYKGLRWDKD